MKSKISALMDGELMQSELTEPLRALREEGEALEAWRTYHLISDSLQDTRILSSGFSARFAERMALEPTILAPASIPPRVAKHAYRAPLSAAASLAAVALVGWLAIQGFGPDAQQVALNKSQDVVRVPPVAMVPMPGGVNDYLLAHQNYSPRSTLQGVAPYVRTVSDSARPR
jgi:sigma-E factor negative regulatory protein RseA